MDTQTIVNFLTPVVVPLIIAGVKLITPKIPTWALPVLSAPLGLAIAYIAQLALHNQANWWLAALLGLAGVGVREIKDQLARPTTDPKD